jgi:hypothetical protein
LLHPIGKQILTKVIDKAQEGTDRCLINGFRPVLQLFDLSGLGSSPFSIENAAPELDRGLIELPLLELELKTLASCLLVEKVHLLDVFLKRCTAYLDVVHAR